MHSLTHINTHTHTFYFFHHLNNLFFPFLPLSIPTLRFQISLISLFLITLFLLFIVKFEYSGSTKELDIESGGLVLVDELNSLFGTKVAALMK